MYTKEKEIYMSIIATIVNLLGLETSSQKASRALREINREREKEYLEFFNPYIKHNEKIIAFMKKMKCQGFFLTELSGLTNEGGHVIKALLVDAENGKTMKCDDTNWNIACFTGIKLELMQDSNGRDYIELHSLLLSDLMCPMEDLMNPKKGPKILEESIINTMDFKMKFTDVFEERIKNSYQEANEKEELTALLNQKRLQRGLSPIDNNM